MRALVLRKDGLGYHHGLLLPARQLLLTRGLALLNIAGGLNERVSALARREALLASF